MTKSRDAFRTISEVADWLDTPAHVLRFWESKFAQVKPVKRAGGRRYYRPSDMALLGGIKKLLHDDGMTIKGVQKMLAERGTKAIAALSPPVEPETEDAPMIEAEEPVSGDRVVPFTGARRSDPPAMPPRAAPSATDPAPAPDDSSSPATEPTPQEPIEAEASRADSDAAGLPADAPPIDAATEPPEQAAPEPASATADTPPAPPTTHAIPPQHAPPPANGSVDEAPADISPAEVAQDRAAEAARDDVTVDASAPASQPAATQPPVPAEAEAEAETETGRRFGITAPAATGEGQLGLFASPAAGDVPDFLARPLAARSAAGAPAGTRQPAAIDAPPVPGPLAHLARLSHLSAAQAAAIRPHAARLAALIDG